MEDYMVGGRFAIVMAIATPGVIPDFFHMLFHYNDYGDTMLFQPLRRLRTIPETG